MYTQRDNIGESSSSSSKSKGRAYRVFLSFMGPDVRYDFGDFLYQALSHMGMSTFRDDDEDKDKNKIEELKKAIRESKVVIIIFSPNFASSTYCLEQAAMFMDRRREKKVEVLPVFFKVEPNDVRVVKGKYGEEFEKHEKKFEERFHGEELEMRKHRLATARATLQRVYEVTPQHVYKQGETRYLSEFIRDIVDDAKRLADLVMLDNPTHVVGHPYRFLGFERWVQDESHEKRIALLHGAQGIGRKTVAVVVSNQNYSHFDATVFLEDVAERSKKPDGIAKLQSQLFSRLVELEGDSKKFRSEKDGRALIIVGLKSNKRVLIVLADMDHRDQLFKLIPGPEFLQNGSKVIVTSGDENLLKDHLCEKFHVMPLTPAQSLELFSWYAFGNATPVEEYKERVVAFLKRYGGNPSVIKAFAKFFSSLGMNRWDELLSGANEDPKLSVSNERKDLKSNFDSLGEDDKKLFLDVACFYAGRNRNHVDSVINNCNMYVEGGFDRLLRRHLLYVDEDKKVTMDRPIMDMGRDIVREKKTECSNIWSPEDAFQALSNRQGARHIRSFILDGRQLEASEMKIKVEGFTEMTNLKLLQLANIKFEGDFKYFPKNLVWLSLNGISFHQMPDNISLNDLVILDVHDSLQRLWSRSKSLGKLKILDLKRWHMLEKTPDFNGLHVPNLERLILEDCIRLVEIHSSIKCLTKLVQLCLKGCVSLEELPTMGSSVEVLDISGCTGLRSMPNISIKSVKELCADRIMVNQLWAEPAGFSFSVVFPSLVKLSVVDCNLSDQQVTGDLARLNSLGELDLRQNPLTSSPSQLLPGRPTLHIRFYREVLSKPN